MKWKREGVIRKTSNNWSRVFQRALKGREKGGWKFCYEEFWPFNAFFTLLIRFSNHPLTWISMIYVYIKPEVLKKWCSSNKYSLELSFYWVIYENRHLVRGIFLVWEMSNFFAAGQGSTPMYRVSSRGLREGTAQSITGDVHKQD